MLTLPAQFADQVQHEINWRWRTLLLPLWLSDALRLALQLHVLRRRVRQELRLHCC